MKSCPTCNRTFNDDTLSFCLDDGTPLVGESSTGPDSEATLVSPSPQPPRDDSGKEALLPTQAYSQLPGRPTWVGSQPQTPPSPGYTAPAPQRKVWPWIVAVVVLLLIGLLGIVIAAVVLPGMMHSSPNANGTRDWPYPSPHPSPVASPSVSPSPSPLASPSTDAGDAPTDPDEVLKQLSDLEDDWEQANADGDKDALDEILADEYTGASRSKQEYLNTVQAHAGRTWQFRNLKATPRGNRADLSGYVDRTDPQGTKSYSFTDNFIWRDGRWQATASQTTEVK